MIDFFLESVSVLALTKTALAFAPFLVGYVESTGDGGNGYRIGRSIRGRKSASPGFTRTSVNPVTDNKKFTFSTWVKKTALPGSGFLISGGAPLHYFGFCNTTADADVLEFRDGSSGTFQVITSSVYRDPAAWYHVILAVDTSQATAANRVRIYVNGAEVAYASSTYPALNTSMNVNTAGLATGFMRRSDSASFYTDYLYADTYLIDGQQLTPSSFGEPNTLTGVWLPKAYSGTYGLNGGYWNWSDNSAATAAAIGKDYSGNNNNLTPANISVTAGATNDSLVDTPTSYGIDFGLGGEVRGNYATLNILEGGQNRNGALEAYNTSTNVWANNRATIAVPASGNWWAEVDIVSTLSAASGQLILGVSDPETVKPNYPGNSATSIGYQSNSTKYVNSIPTSSAGATFGTGDKIGIQINAGTVYFYKLISGAWALQFSQALVSTMTSVLYSFACYSTTEVVNVNFGQRPWAATPPSGAKAVCTQNLPDPIIKRSSDYFSSTIFTGDGTTNRDINVGFSPDLVWHKCRSTGPTNHELFDTSRTVGSALYSNLTNAEGAESEFIAFNSTGFRVSQGANNTMNFSGRIYVDWSWKKSITSGFDIVTYTGNGSNRTIAHSLGVAPKMMIVKQRSAGTSNWVVYFESLGAGNFMLLNGSAASAALSTLFNNTTPTASVFSLGTDNNVNTNAATYIAYLFAEVPSFSKFGSYTGNGSADGTFSYCGFRPRWIMVKSASASADWYLWDTARDTNNIVGNELLADGSAAEFTAQADIDIISNGFKIRRAGSAFNTSGHTYIFAAFAENPFKYATAR